MVGGEELPSIPVSRTEKPWQSSVWALSEREDGNMSLARWIFASDSEVEQRSHRVSLLFWAWCGAGLTVLVGGLMHFIQWRCITGRRLRRRRPAQLKSRGEMVTVARLETL